MAQSYWKNIYFKINILDLPRNTTSSGLRPKTPKVLEVDIRGLKSGEISAIIGNHD